MITAQDIWKIYANDRVAVEALRGVSLAIEQGELLAIMGHSGSGKSTLLSILGCMDRPTRGSYTLAGKVVQGLSDRELAYMRSMHIGFVFQSYNLVPQCTVMENVQMPIMYRTRDDIPTANVVDTAIDRMGIGHRRNHFPNELSGGEMQRVAIARAIVGKPQVLLADEPTGNLDSGMSKEIMGVFQSLNRDGMTIVVVTHNPTVAAECQRTVNMRDGCVVAMSDIADEERRS